MTPWSDDHARTQLNRFLDRALRPGRLLRTQSELRGALSGGGPGRAVTVNLYDLYCYITDDSYADLVDTADWLTADGAPIASALRRLGAPADRVTGADLCLDLASSPLDGELTRIAVLGSTRAAVREYARRLSGQGRRIVFADCGDRADWKPGTVGERIEASAADLVLVAVGTPYGAAAAARLAPALSCPVVPVGAGVGMAAGTERRAPRAFQLTRLEWAWRLATDPRRLTQRYVVECPQVLLPLRAAVRDMAAENRAA